MSEWVAVAALTTEVQKLREALDAAVGLLKTYEEPFGPTCDDRRTLGCDECELDEEGMKICRAYGYGKKPKREKMSLGCLLEEVEGLAPGDRVDHEFVRLADGSWRYTHLRCNGGSLVPDCFSGLGDTKEDAVMNVIAQIERLPEGGAQ